MEITIALSYNMTFYLNEIMFDRYIMELIKQPFLLAQKFGTFHPTAAKIQPHQRVSEIILKNGFLKTVATDFVKLIFTI